MGEEQGIIKGKVGVSPDKARVRDLPPANELHTILGPGRVAIISLDSEFALIVCAVALKAGLITEDWILILAVAADGGVMPQTKEHLHICNLLNIQFGIITIKFIILTAYNCFYYINNIYGIFRLFGIYAKLFYDTISKIMLGSNHIWRTL